MNLFIVWFTISFLSEFVFLCCANQLMPGPRIPLTYLVGACSLTGLICGWGIPRLHPMRADAPSAD